ncbi:Smr/MutS family protein, partial [Salmonella enterica]
RKGVREYLNKNSRIESFNDAPANQGGNGATIVQLK